ncbi:solute carrier family 35 member C2 [Histoplasma capsulatum]|uniref:Solute carrier family 35 member C2 n=1 Tax=Ajellomyces capsulatus TaxID=5037 RepID=A0A8A1MJG2_AJECA|nr:solute carrier family 35 member C2 [Histoplasma capsulatum]
MDFLASDDHLNDDEETGLTAKERRQRWKQRRRHRRELDARIVEVKVSEHGRRLADRAVVKRLGVNAILIGSCTTNGCSHPTTLIFNFPSSPQASIWLYSLSYPPLCSTLSLRYDRMTHPYLPPPSPASSRSP